MPQKNDIQYDNSLKKLFSPLSHLHQLMLFPATHDREQQQKQQQQKQQQQRKQQQSRHSRENISHILYGIWPGTWHGQWADSSEA